MDFIDSSLPRSWKSSWIEAGCSKHTQSVGILQSILTQNSSAHVRRGCVFCASHGYAIIDSSGFGYRDLYEAWCARKLERKPSPSQNINLRMCFCGSPPRNPVDVKPPAPLSTFATWTILQANRDLLRPWRDARPLRHGMGINQEIKVSCGKSHRDRGTYGKMNSKERTHKTQPKIKATGEPRQEIINISSCSIILRVQR